MIDGGEWLCTEGLLDSGIIDVLWDRGWRAPTGQNLRAAQHRYPAYAEPGGVLPDRAVVACLVHDLPDAIEQVKHDGRAGGAYIFVTGPGDQSLNDGGGWHCNVREWPDFIWHIFGHSVITKTPRVTPMPMAFHAFRGFVDPVREALAIPRKKTNRVLVAYSLDIGGVTARPDHERMTAIDYFRGQPHATVCPKLLDHVPGTGVTPWPHAEYLAHLREHDFVACPIGYGIERIAYWEAMVLGTIPICRPHLELRHFVDMPIAFVDDWREVIPSWCDANAHLINRPIDKLRLDYWIARIREKREELFA